MYNNLETLVYLFWGLLYGKICAKPETASLLNPGKTIMWQIQCHHSHPIWGGFNSYLLTIADGLWL